VHYVLVTVTVLMQIAVTIRVLRRLLHKFSIESSTVYYPFLSCFSVDPRMGKRRWKQQEGALFIVTKATEVPHYGLRRARRNTTTSSPV